MKPSDQDLDGRLALLVEWRDAERRLDLMEARPSRVNLIIRRDKERRYEQELRERAAKEAPDATAD